MLGRADRQNATGWPHTTSTPPPKQAKRKGKGAAEKNAEGPSEDAPGENIRQRGREGA